MLVVVGSGELFVSAVDRSCVFVDCPTMFLGCCVPRDGAAKELEVGRDVQNEVMRGCNIQPETAGK